MSNDAISTNLFVYVKFILRSRAHFEGIFRGVPRRAGALFRLIERYPIANAFAISYEKR